MKIRDLKQYRKILAKGNETGSPGIGRKGEELFARLYGDDRNLEAELGEFTSMAQDTALQVVFEFIQNADDAHSTEMSIFFDKQNLIVVNNGKPFYTSSNKADKGQLKGFIRKGSSDKYQDTDSKGKFGVGSKLLYDLFTDITTPKKKSERLIQALINDTKGPILYSWNNREDFLSFSAGFPIQSFQTEDCESVNNPLLCKLYYTYYPCMPNEEGIDYYGNECTFFPSAELAKARTFFSKCFPNPSQKNQFKQGSLLYLELGNGQYQNIKETLENPQLEERIKVALAILEVSSRRRSRPKEPLEVVKIAETGSLDRELLFRKATNLEQLDLKLPDNKDFKFLHPKVPTTDHPLTPNFYVSLPVIDEEYGFHFIIDSEEFQLTESRQSIDWKETSSQSTINGIFGSLEKHLTTIPFKDYLPVFTSILLSLDANPKPEPLQAFLELLKEFMHRNIPTSKGQKLVADSVVIPNYESKLNFDELGIIDFQEITEELKGFSSRFIHHFPPVKEWDLTDVLHHADAEKARNWILSLNTNSYSTLLDDIQQASRAEVNKTAFIRFSNGQIYSPNDILQSKELFLISPKLDGLQVVLGKKLGATISQETFTSTSKFSTFIEEYEDELLDRLLTYFNANPDKANPHRQTITRFLLQKFRDEEEVDSIRENIEFYKNITGDYCPINELRSGKNNNDLNWFLATITLSSQQYHAELEVLLLKPEEEWGIIKPYWEELIDEVDIERYDQNAQKIYAYLLECIKNSDEEVESIELECFITQNQEISGSASILFHQKLLKQSEKEYYLLSQFIQDNTDYKLLPYTHLTAVSSLPVKWEGLSLRNLASYFKSQIACKVSLDQLQLLLKTFSSSNFFNHFFFNHFILSENRNGEITIRVKKSQEWQYYLQDEKVIQRLATEDNYHLLPAKLEKLFKDDESLKRGNNPEFVEGLIDDFGADQAFIDLVNEHGKAVKDKYLNNIDELPLSSEERYNDDSFEYQVLKLGKDQGMVEKLQKAILIEANGEQIKLTTIQYQDRIAVGRKKFSLTQLLPDLDLYSDTLAKVARQFRDFPEYFEQEEYPIEHIVDQLQLLSNPEQLAFYIAYQLEKEEELKTLECSLSIPKQLDALRAWDLDKYPKYYSITGFEKPSEFFLSNHSCLLHSEKLPTAVAQWLGGDKEKYKFLKNIGVRDPEKDPAIQFRQQLKENSGYTVIETLFDEKKASKILLENTLKWIEENIKDTFDRSGAKYNGLQDLYKQLITQGNHQQQLLLIDPSSSKGNKLKVRVETASEWSNYSYLKGLPKDDSTAVRQLLKGIGQYQLKVIDGEGDEFSKKLQEKGLKEISVFKELDKEKTHEVSPKPWSQDAYGKYAWQAYEEWKKDKEVKYRVFFTAQEIPFQYYLKKGDTEPLPIDSKKEGASGFDRKDEEYRIYLYKNHEAFKDKPIGTLLQEENEKRGDEAFFKRKEELRQLSRLQALLEKEASTETKELQEEIKRLQQAQIQPQQQELLDFTSGSGFSSVQDLQGALGKTGDYSFESREINETERGLLDKLLGKLTEEEEVEKLLRLVNSVEDLDMLGNIEEQKKATPNSITGYIGECLIKHLLEQVKGSDVSLVAHYTPEYDILYRLANQELYFEVKTTRGSVYAKDGNSKSFPIYLKASQFQHIRDKIREELDNSYYLVRIGLRDIDLLWLSSKYEGETEKTEEIKKEIEEATLAFIGERANRKCLLENMLFFKLSYDQDMYDTLNSDEL